MGAPSSRRLRATGAFEFVAIGDVPYTRGDRARFRHLARRINALPARFVVHVGDTQEGGSKASPRGLERMAAVFEELDGPLLFTPGDNDWSDCKRGKGGYGPEDALSDIRTAFFSSPQTLGRKSFRVARQPDEDPLFAEFVENCRFVLEHVVFVVLHVVRSDARADRSRQRQREASVAWLHRAFDEAEPAARGLVVLTHADLRYHAKRRERAGFDPLLSALAERAEAFARPVWIVHGDKHEFLVERPPLPPLRPEGLPNVHRVQVMGGKKNVHGVRIEVDPGSRQLLLPEALLVRENLGGPGLYRGPQP